MLLGDGIHVGGICCFDGITFEAFLWSDSPSVMDATVFIISETDYDNQVPLHYSHQTDFILDFRHGDDEQKRGSLRMLPVAVR